MERENQLLQKFLLVNLLQMINQIIKILTNLSHTSHNILQENMREP